MWMFIDCCFLSLGFSRLDSHLGDVCKHGRMCSLEALRIDCFHCLVFSHSSAVALESCNFEADYLDLVLNENVVKHIALNFLLLALLSLFCMKNSCKGTASLCLLFCLDLGPNEKPCEHTHTAINFFGLLLYCFGA